MNSVPRHTLQKITAKYGKDICTDARRCAGLLNDLCGSFRREINVLVNAIDERVPLDLLAGAGSMPLELLLTRLEKRFEDNTGLTEEAARWAVESWALALGVATSAEIEERERKKTEAVSGKERKTQTIAPENKPANQSVPDFGRTNPVQPPWTQTPVTSSKTASPSNRPVKIPNSPPVFLPKNNQPPMRAPKVNPQIQKSNPIVVAKSRFGVFRGCLIVIFLLAVTSIVLLFGVPYAIEVMRETQRERNNEPPRFPVR